jgi:hypothetical protein
MTSENLKKLATLLREKAASVQVANHVKCGQVIQAAQALNILREKVSSHVR